MSWNIFVYAEVKRKGSAEWRPLTNSAVCDDFKYYKDDFYDELPRMKAADAVHPMVKELGNDKCWDADFYVSYCDLKDLRKHYVVEANTFNTKLKSVYAALGVDIICIDDEDYWCNDEVAESESEYDKSNPWVKYMTLPVNKKMLTDLAASFHTYNKAMQILGFCDTIASMCENYDDDVRLLFAML